MKKIILITLLLMTFCCVKSFSQQNNDSITTNDIYHLSDSVNLVYHQFAFINNEIKNINLRLEWCHQQYKNGTIMIISGIGICAISTFLISKPVRLDSKGKDLNQQSRDVGKILLLASVPITFIGLFTQIDSHKYLSKKH